MHCALLWCNLFSGNKWNPLGGRSLCEIVFYWIERQFAKRVMVICKKADATVRTLTVSAISQESSKRCFNGFPKHLSNSPSISQRYYPILQGRYVQECVWGSRIGRWNRKVKILSVISAVIGHNLLTLKFYPLGHTASYITWLVLT